MPMDLVDGCLDHATDLISGNTADYDNARVWSSTEAANTLLTAAEAYRRWSSIKNTDMAREYLLDVLSGNR